jgi:Glycosyl transferase family 2
MAALRFEDGHPAGAPDDMSEMSEPPEVGPQNRADSEAFGRFQVVADRLALRTATVGVFGLDRVGFGWFVAAGSAFAQVVGVDPDATRIEAVEASGSESAIAIAALHDARLGDSATALVAADVVVLALPAVGRTDAIVADAVPGLRAGQLVVVVSDDAPAAASLFMGLARAGLVPGRDVALAHAAARPGDRTSIVGADPIASVLATQFLRALQQSADGTSVPDLDLLEAEPHPEAAEPSPPTSLRDAPTPPKEFTAGRISILLPCRNEAITIADVVRSFHAALPTADVYVYDNASTDATAELAREAGAIVRHAPVPGKGNVVRRMFAEIDADVYVLADGDDTYDVGAAPQLIRELRSQCLDMVVGRRVEPAGAAHAYPPGHRLGNRLLTGIVQRLFGSTCEDMLSGYRVFSRRYVKSFPAFSGGFETETEMTVHALDLAMPIAEVATEYRQRPEESTSKLRTIPDGLRISRFILRLFKEYEPLRFFGLLALLSGLLAAGVAIGGTQVLSERFAGQLAIACCGLGVVLATAGVILDTVSRSRREMKRIMYLAQPYGFEQSSSSDGSVPVGEEPFPPAVDVTA